MAHLASCFSCIEILYSLYINKKLRYDPNNSTWQDRDRLILSKGHGGLALYCILWQAGLISEDVYKSYLQADSLIGGEPCTRDCEWIEATTGSLGHGLSMGMGMAMSLKADQSPAKVYVILGDGECEEGTVWEAIITAPAFHLSNLVAILDCNNIQKMDSVEKTIGTPNWRQKWETFGWKVIDVDGHDVNALNYVFDSIHVNNYDCPQLIIAHTVKGKGVSIMENNPNWHFKLPGRKELKVFKQELNISDSELGQNNE